MNLARIRNKPRRLHLVKPAINAPAIAGIWGPLAAPVDPLETVLRIRAQALMTPTPRGGACPPLSIEQARDVLAWYRPTATL